MTFMEIPGHIYNHYSPRSLGQETSSQNPGPLVMKKILVPPGFDQLREQHGDSAIRMVPLHFENAVDDGFHYESKRRFE